MTTLYVDDSLVPIPLKRRKVEDDDSKKASTIKLRYKPLNYLQPERTTDGISPCSTLDIESLLEAITEIRDVVGPNRLDVDVPAKKFSIARDVFRGVARDAYDLAIDGMPQTDDNFNNSMPRELLLQATSSNAYSMQRAYLTRLRKPFEMDLPTFQHRLRHIKKMMVLLPRRNGEPEMTDFEFKTIYINAMPEKFRAEYFYKYEHQALTTTTFAEITERFGSIKRHLDVVEKIDNKRNNNNKKNDNSNGNHNGNKNNNKYNNQQNSGRGGGSGRGGRGNNSNKNNKIKNPCRLPGHEGHDWSECKTNRNSSNYDPNFVPRHLRDNNSATSGRTGSRSGNNSGRGNASNNNNGGRGKQQSYAADVSVSSGRTDSTIPSQVGNEKGEAHWFSQSSYGRNNDNNQSV